MAKTNKEAIIKLCKEIEKKQGEGSIHSLGANSVLKIKRWPSGIEGLDYVIGGGVPEGRIIEISGPESAGKTSLAYHLCSMTDLCLFIPAEGTFDANRANVFGNRPKQMLVYKNVTHGNDAMNKAMQFAQAGIPLIVIDSVPALIPKDEYEQAMKDFDKENRIGGVARLLSRTLKPLQDVCEVTGTTIIFINQVRDKMDAMMFGEKTQTPGGRALRHYSSIRIQVARRAWIDIPNKDPMLSSDKKQIGLIMKLKVIKSKVCDPFGEVELPMLFNKGFISFDDVALERKAMMKGKGFKEEEDDD